MILMGGEMLKRSESGQTLLIALILLAVGSLLVIPVLQHVFTDMRFNNTLECRTLNDYSADAGLQYATCEIYNNPGIYTSAPLSDNLTINGRTVNINAEYMGGGLFSINSTAYGGDCGRTTIRSFVNLSVGAFAYALAGMDSLVLGNVIIDSTPTPGGGDIHSNANIEITGQSSLVNGDASCVGVITKGEDRITGEIEEGSASVEFPSVYADLYRTIAQEGGTHNGDLTLTGSGAIGPLYITGMLDIKPGASFALEGPIYVVGDIKGTGGHLDGQEHILTEGNINMSGGGYGSEYIPVLVAISGDVSLVGPVVDAVVYAPQGRIDLTNLQLFGAAGGVEVDVSNAIITYSESLHGRTDLPGSELFPLTYTYD
jgi:hypothetical protein